jgi:putative hydrolase of the HAD superfamily
MPYTTLFFDLDDTLYPSSTGLWNAIRDRIVEYMHARIGIAWDEIPELRHRLLETYGSTLRGLQQFYPVDADDYLAFVHDVPLEQYLRPAPALRAMLTSIPQKRWVFTNADANHAQRVLAVLGLNDCFHGLIDLRALNFVCKPEMETYYRALSLAGESRADQAMLLDDSPRNLLPAKVIGFTTVLVGHETPDGLADFAIPSLINLRQDLPFLWERGSDG